MRLPQGVALPTVMDQDSRGVLLGAGSGLDAGCPHCFLTCVSQDQLKHFRTCYKTSRNKKAAPGKAASYSCFDRPPRARSERESVAGGERSSCCRDLAVTGLCSAGDGG